QSQKGIYIAAGGAWARSEDGNTAAELTNALVPVAEGTVNANTTYRQQTTSIVLGTSNIVFQTYGTLVPDADSATKGKMKLYNVTGAATDGAITQALFTSEINTLTTAVGGKKNNDVIAAFGISYPAQYNQRYICYSVESYFTDPALPSVGKGYTIFAKDSYVTIDGVTRFYALAEIYRYYNGASWKTDVHYLSNNYSLTKYSSGTIITLNNYVSSVSISSGTDEANEITIDEFYLFHGAENAGAGATVTLYVFDNSNGGFPGTKLHQEISAAGILIGANKVISFTSNLTLPPGIYWVGLHLRNLDTAGVNPTFHFSALGGNSKSIETVAPTYTNNFQNTLRITTASDVGNNPVLGTTVAASTLSAPMVKIKLG
ncbi:MAG: hypothetical protein ACK4ON_09865, partial [Bacteroidia bacterium]